MKIVIFYGLIAYGNLLVKGQGMKIIKTSTCPAYHWVL